jgi:quinol monooxygenase YgiN
VNPECINGTGPDGDVSDTGVLRGDRAPVSSGKSDESPVGRQAGDGTRRFAERDVGRLEALVLASRLDSGVMIFDLHRSTTDPAVWFLYERYESQEHFNRHRENPVLRRFLADAATLLDGNLDVRTFRVILI